MVKEKKYPTPSLDDAQRADLVRRGMVAWFKEGGTDPPNSASSVEMLQGLAYVVLRGNDAVLAVYRVRQMDGYLMLRRLSRWPRALA